MTSRKTSTRIERRDFIVQGAAALAMAGTAGSLSAADDAAPLKFGLNADPHLLGRRARGNEANFKAFVDQMKQFNPDFAIDLGDFGCQIAEGQTTQEMHDGQLEALKHHVSVFAQVGCPRYHVIGNHDVGWLKGGDEEITPDDLIGRGHAGEDITKAEFLKATGTPHRYYSFDVRGFHFVVLDGNNPPDSLAPRGKDGIVGGYWIDDTQKAWLEKDLAKNRQKPKIVFCHEELHHTPERGSGQGGDTPFEAVGKQTSYVDNGWEIRKLFAEDGRVLACFFGHKHRNRWTVYDDTNYITLAATHWKCSFAQVEIADTLSIKGFGGQRSYQLPLPTWATNEARK
ncbi:MAG: hypothetical protein CMJ78_13865 [Planctomycetaceae bacterium]|nr:hypothetical protein [Planctomycetaceae bacterium]